MGPGPVADGRRGCHADLPGAALPRRERAVRALVVSALPRVPVDRAGSNHTRRVKMIGLPCTVLSQHSHKQPPPHLSPHSTICTYSVENRNGYKLGLFGYLYLF